MKLKIPNEEIRERQKKFTDNLKEMNVESVILFNTTDIFYLTNFMFRPSERPIAFFIDDSNKTHLFVPRMEYSHAENYAVIDYIHEYIEYPGETHPM